MLRIGRAAAVAEEKQLAARTRRLSSMIASAAAKGASIAALVASKASRCSLNLPPRNSVQSKDTSPFCCRFDIIVLTIRRFAVWRSFHGITMIGLHYAFKSVLSRLS
jgi:hypothetical protein